MPEVTPCLPYDPWPWQLPTGLQLPTVPGPELPSVLQLPSTASSGLKSTRVTSGLV